MLRDWLRRERGVDLADYEALRRWSVEQLAEFWQALWDHFGLQSPTPCSAVLSGPEMPGARWFEGTQLNYAAEVLRQSTHAAAAVPALVFRNERLQREGRSVEIGWPELVDQVAALAATLQGLGIRRGDRVAAYLPNIPQAAVAFLACASIGAIWSLTAPDMGVGTVRDRFQQIEPKLLIACDGTVYGGKVADRRDTVVALLTELPSVHTLLLVPYLEVAGAAGAAEVPFGFDPGAWTGRVLSWSAALATPERLGPQPLPFAHPLWIVYSSGTTGLPKPIVHGHGGVVLEMLKLHAFHFNLQPGMVDGRPSHERLQWYSSTGWVMWNLTLSALLRGTTVCLYDGHPSFPEPDTLWHCAQAMQTTFFGAGAAYFAACLKAGVEPARAGLERVRALGATGSPLAPEVYTWAWDKLRPDLWWAVISGGTDFASAFLGGTPELPTVPGEMQARCLGMDIEAWDEQGRPLVDEVGELVCKQPMPSMPLFFWGDGEDQRRYRESYFDTYPGVWRHGDWLRLTPGGSAIVYGRSDATLNRHGLRLGTAEMYRVVEALPQVLDSLVVDIEVLGRPSFMPLFVVLRPGLRLDEALLGEIRRCIREQLSPRFLPDAIEQVAEVPRTLTGKKQELPVKKLLLGRVLAEVVNPGACANPGAFDEYVQFARRHAAAAGSGG